MWMFVLDQFLFNVSCLIRLKLGYCVFNPAGAVSWKNLRSLCISYGKLDEDLIQNIFSGSPVLETLELNYCYGFRRLEISSHSVKNLVFSGYRPPYYTGIRNGKKSIEINAPNVLSLTIRNNLTLLKLSLLSVSSLVKAHLDYISVYKNEHYVYACGLDEEDYISELTEEEDMLKGFVLNLRHVKELKLGFACLEVSCIFFSKFASL